MKTLITTITLTLALISVISCSPFLTLKTNQVHEGIGFNNFILGQTTKKQIIKKLGTNSSDFGPKHHMEYRKKGIELTVYDYSDTSKLMFISFKPNKLKGETTSGLILNRTTTIEDVYKSYGQPDGRYGIDGVYVGRYDDNTFDLIEFTIDYPEKGIAFRIEPDILMVESPEIINDSTLIAESLDKDNIYFKQKISDVIIYKK